MNASDAPVAVGDVLAESEIAMGGGSQAIHILKSSRNDTLASLGLTGKITNVLVEVKDFIGQLLVLPSMLLRNRVAWLAV